MLDESEYEEVARLYDQAMRLRKVPKIDHAQDPPDVIDRLFEPVRAAYLGMTGFVERNHIAIMHHRLSLYGPPCRVCAKPLRTSKAKHCAACGTPV